jgi:hypothetical protein
VQRYDPSQTPDPVEWLALDEQERTLLVEQYHRKARVKLPNIAVHATIHAAVENQLAANDEPVVRALDRLIRQGLSRHDAIHAIGSVVATQIYDALNSKEPKDLNASYYAAIERLSAKKWLSNHDG